MMPLDLPCTTMLNVASPMTNASPVFVAGVERIIALMGAAGLPPR